MLPPEVLSAGKYGFVAIVATVLLAALRNQTVRVIAAVIDIVAIPLRNLHPRLLAAADPLRERAQETLRGLRYSPDGYTETDRDREAWNGWNVIGPFIYTAAFVFVGAGDAYLLYLRFGALLRLPTHPLPLGSLELFGTLLWVAALLVFAMTLFDLLGLTPLRQPYAKLRGIWRRNLLILAVAELWLGFVGTACFYIWGQYQIFNSPHTGLALDFLVILSALLSGALVCAGWSLPVTGAALWALLLIALRGLVVAGAAAMRAMFWVADAFVAVADTIVQLLATPGRLLWNWFAGSDWAGRRRLGEIEWDERPQIGIPHSHFDEELEAPPEPS
jgi:hypothetical protein